MTDTEKHIANIGKLYKRCIAIEKSYYKWTTKKELINLMILVSESIDFADSILLGTVECRTSRKLLKKRRTYIVNRLCVMEDILKSELKLFNEK